MEEQGTLSQEHDRPARRVEIQPKKTDSSRVTEEALKRQREQIAEVIKMLNAFVTDKTYSAAPSKLLRTLLQTEEVMDEAVLSSFLRVSQIKITTDAEPDVLFDEVLHILSRLEARQAREILNLLYKEQWFSGEMAASDMAAKTPDNRMVHGKAKNVQPGILDSSAPYSEEQGVFVQTMLHTLIQNDQDAVLFANEYRVPLHSLQGWREGTALPEKHLLQEIVEH